MYHVHGLRRDPTEPLPAPIPHPPVAHEPRMQQLVDDFRSQGLHPFHMPVGINLIEDNLPFSTCVKCNRCDGFPRLIHAKGDAEVMGVRPGLCATSSLTLLTHATCSG